MKTIRLPHLLLSVLAALFALMVAASALSAQNMPPTEITVEFYGTIQSANPSALVINGQVIDISGAQLSAPPTTGLVVRVIAVAQADGTIAARQIDPVPVGMLPGIVVLMGAISDVNQSTLMLGDQMVDISDAVILNALQIGDSVRLLVVADTPGRWRALLVGSPDNPAFAPLGTPDPAIRPPSSNLQAPNATPEISSAPPAPPVSTPEIGVIPPMTTPEVDDHGGGGDDGGGDDHSGSGSG
ncbi:MAG: hypothetical protein SGI73_08815 [Chloroflexota bacterium]|nr:hypothetical protein [Chloroflexota bacterium]